MSGYDRVVIVDWSAGNDTGARPRKDAIWLGEAGCPPVYLRNRVVAEQHLCALIKECLKQDQRLFLGFDFPFGYPSGFAQEITGRRDPLALWDWLETQLHDTPSANTRFDLAAKVNRMFPGTGPFWFNGLKREIPDLPRKDIREGHGLAEHRRAETLAKGSFPCWQMGGAGAVGGQVMTGVAMLARLRRAFPQALSVWPFEPLTAPVSVVEVWPSLVAGEVRAHMRPDEIKDAAQVRILSDRIAALTAEEMTEIVRVDAPEEGWIFGLGHEDKLRQHAPA